ncbi:hypothetical protein DAEQUDRAFT_461549 [Daedalea quercina L-15889]|uniref:Uncharacterized protein n=1 Tax=Daedalea quercina L-15889 TaxID=1314783 RepID=A0A165TD48_9APHY|nr:hypothetical protein DAEQUDRAFT_461549 [Daedalea quercina L-15889]
MRLTPSSSLLIATLALSSSSSSLAAPTDGDVNGLSTSSSMHGIHARDSVTLHVGDGGVNLNTQNTDAQPGPDHGSHNAHDKRLDLGAALEGVPILGPALSPLIPMLEPIFNALGLGDGKSGGPSALLALTPSQVSQVQQAVAQAIISAGPSNVTGITSNLPVPALPTSALGSVASNVPMGRRDDYDYSGGNMTSTNCSSMPNSSGASSTWSPVSTFAAFSVPSDVPLDSPGPADIAAPSGLPVSPPTGSLPVGGANPLSPSLPANPPNTPVAPPIPVGPAPSGSSSFSSAGTAPTATADMFDAMNNTTPPLFMSSTAVANSSSTAYYDSSSATSSVDATSSYPSSTASF